MRSFGPSFNTVLVNGRRIVSETGGREFSFDLYPAELISGAQIYKSGAANIEDVANGSLLAEGEADTLVDAEAGMVDVNVQRPLNAETAEVEDWEIVSQYVFDFGLGFSANATFMDSNVGVSPD